jgi:CRISPR-associated endonuclease Csn1
MKKILSLDLGRGETKNSTGYAVINNNGVDNKEIIAYGSIIKYVGDNKKRRAMRLGRNRLKHKRQLKKSIKNLLIKTFNIKEDFYIHNGDVDFYNAFKNSYKVKIELEQLARILYYSFHHRGYIESRKFDVIDEKENENENEEENLKKKEENKIKEKISVVKNEMGDKNIGEFLYDKFVNENRVRGELCFDNKTIKNNIKNIILKQKEYYPNIITKTFVNKILTKLSQRRPLPSFKNMIGFCSFEENKKRCKKASFEFQEFRILQQLNNLRIDNKELTKEQFDLLYNNLSKKSKMTKDKILKLFGYKKNININLEEITGNTINSTMINNFGEDWWNNVKDKEKVVQDLVSIRSLKCLYKRGIIYFNSDKEKASKFSKINLEVGYSDLSLSAINKLIKEIKNGCGYSTAVKNIYGDLFYKKIEINDKTTIYDNKFSRLRNEYTDYNIQSSMAQCLSLFKKNKPDCVYIESTREEKKKKNRNKNKRNTENKTNKEINDEIVNKLKRDFGITTPKGKDIERYQLCEEMNHVCAYCGDIISFTSSEIDHIYPRKRYYDNSFTNKAICCSKCNLEKGIRTVYEAWGNDEKRMNIIKSRFEKNCGKYSEKTRRVLNKDFNDMSFEFTNANLNGTAKMAMANFKMFCMIFGCNFAGFDINGVQRVILINPNMTASIRRNLHIVKDRGWYSHHAQDAVIMGLIDKNNFNDILNFKVNSIAKYKEQIKGIQNDAEIYHKYNGKVNCQLHEETLYGLIEKNKCFIHKNIENLTPSMVEQIIDDKIKEELLNKLNECKKSGKNLGEKGVILGLSERDEGFFESRKIAGKIVKRVKILQNETPLKMTDKNNIIKYVKTGGNHHLEIFDDGGNIDTKMVTSFEANQRRKNKLKIFNFNNDKNYIGSYKTGDIFEFDGEKLKTKSMTFIKSSGQIIVKFDNVKYMTEKNKCEKQISSKEDLRQWLKHKI